MPGNNENAGFYWPQAHNLVNFVSEIRGETYNYVLFSQCQHNIRKWPTLSCTTGGCSFEEIEQN